LTNLTLPGHSENLPFPAKRFPLISEMAAKVSYSYALPLDLAFFMISHP